MPDFDCSFASSVDLAIFNFNFTYTSGWSFIDTSSNDKVLSVLFKTICDLLIDKPKFVTSCAMSLAETEPYNWPDSLAALIIIISLKFKLFAKFSASF